MLRPENADAVASPPGRGATLARLAARLGEAADVEAVGQRLADHGAALVADGAARVWVLGPGDRCATCPRAKDCPSKERCFHLIGGTGAFSQPPGHADRVPIAGTSWGEALAATEARRLSLAPPELAAPGTVRGDATAVVAPLRIDGKASGVVGLRLAEGTPEETVAAVAEGLSEAALLAAAAIGAASARAVERRRFEELLLVSDLGRKVNSILNLDLLLRQAVVDIQRTFGYRHVTFFMLDARSKRIQLKAQSSRYENSDARSSSIALTEGVVGRVARSGRTVRVDDVSGEPDYVNWWPDTKSEVAVPVRIGGLVEGVINVESDRVGAFGESDVVVLETAANQLAIAIENARLFGRVKESEEEYRTLVESSPNAILQLDVTGRLVYGNPAVSDLTGIDKGAVLSRFAHGADLAIPEDRERLAAAVARAIEGHPQRSVEFRTAHADGRPRWIAAEFQPLVGEAGGRKGVLLLARNITREKELQSQLHQSEKLKAMGEMVSGVAHELNNPLSGILGYAQLYLSRPPEQWPRRDMEKIEVNARRCKRIVENLLTFARQSRTEKQPTNLNEVIESVVALNEYQFRMDNVELARDFDARLPQLPLDISRWQQVFINLATNAREAMVEAKSPVRRITFSTRLRGDEIVVRVEDTGPGIARDHLGRVFEPFFTTKQHGTGLGLGLCFGIVTEHGGTITADSEPGRGAVFTIRLPRAGAEPPPPTPSPEPKERSALAGAGLRALVVDDEQVVRDVVTHVLELHGYEVDTAGDSTEALDRASQRSYDVVLTDLRMPGELDGMGLHERIATTNPALARRFVFMTGDIMEHGMFRDIEQMGLSYVKKPFDIRELARVVNALTGKGSGAPPPAAS
jgi:two-component system NtrC family sensor kinase